MKSIVWIFLFLVFSMLNLFSQPEVYPWGNITGVRLDGEIMELNTSLNLVGKDWNDIRKTNKEVGQYQYRREGNTQFNTINWGGFIFDQSVEALGAGQANVRIYFRSEHDTAIIGSFFKLELPSDKYNLSSLELMETNTSQTENIPQIPGEQKRMVTNELKINGDRRNLKITLSEETLVIVKKESSEKDSPIELYFALMTGRFDKGMTGFNSLHISATGAADLSPFTLTIDKDTKGKKFTGFGGNFRLQNMNSDPQVIDYCLENMNVRWGRVEMPWRFWHPNEDDDPINIAQKGEIHPHVKASMEMADRLNKLGMPVILSCWSGPTWAIEGEFSWRPQPGGLRGNPLDKAKTKHIYKSIADYIQYVKDEYGFEFAMFSFNESDLGIYIRQTPEEHAALIKGLGAHLESRGIKTKLLLGDTADANGWPFLKSALEDSKTHPYIGAVSFHSWRGYTDENLKKWADAAERMNLPLLVGEGSMDAGAHRYPDIFKEPMYAMEEMNLYVRILKICQPEAILQWQLTADYSPLSGGGVFGETNKPLEPTQRFWNFKQIADMPEGLFAMPIEADKDNVTCAALGDPVKKKYVVHVVNNGAARQAILKGLPEDIRFLNVYVSNERSNMARKRIAWVRNGEASFFAESNSFITLMTDGELNR